MKSIEEYNNHFKRLFKKVNPNNETLAANTIQQFLNRLNLIIAFLIYVEMPATLQVVIDTTKSIKAGYKIT